MTCTENVSNKTMRIFQSIWQGHGCLHFHTTTGRENIFEQPLLSSDTNWSRGYVDNHQER